MVTPVEEFHPQLDNARGLLLEAARHLDVHPSIIEQLGSPKESMTARLMVRMDDNTERSFTAWRCRYDDTKGPTKGGIRFHPDASLDEVETLAFRMMCKCAVMNLPFGGGKGAVRVDPRTLSRAELERLSRAYVRAFYPLMGPDRDIPAPDVNTNASVMGWMVDEYSALAGKPQPAFITGKPIALGGSLGRSDATARGGFHVVKNLEKELNLADCDKTVCIQGFGNAGQHMATFLHNDGYKIVGLSDSRGAVYCADGIDAYEAVRVKHETGMVSALAGMNGIQTMDPDDLIAADCCLLVPAALEEMINKDNAHRVKAKVILELANGPVTPKADKILEDNGVIVVPDILANAGGVTVSYFEWVQNLQMFYWELDEIHTRLKAIMDRESRAIWELAKATKTSMRTSAYIHALRRLNDAIEAGGTQGHDDSR
ncbi:Glu/Leu/Phe/Val dehydrogenase [Phaeovibrio sulfidiphilus]|uniref:Glutamate dehydrogenase n=1 Tax=Phaeovibrio sulfidiphilus TaxID=1220600 RepID=A0A8J6YWR2_9PROT|nr:Glu/Leu/Phe/Val dehydrogenase [Phaeovibrio sulfidiphilus]MBE1237874.1 Glu/Leu/Phe/Val dehydrogenase [Phaeovibrio sulfidiphilus]